MLGSYRYCFMECSQPSEVDIILTVQTGNLSSEKLSAVGKGRVGQRVQQRAWDHVCVHSLCFLRWLWSVDGVERVSTLTREGIGGKC